MSTLALVAGSLSFTFHNESCSLLPGNLLQGPVNSVDHIIWTHLFHMIIDIEN